MVTILQVAEEAGVSVATVSRVINRNGPVKERTARRVLDAVNRLGYAPNLNARNLRRHESGTILVLLPNIINPYYANIFNGLNLQAREMGYNLILSNTQGRNQEEILRDAIEKGQVDGAVLLAVSLEDDWIEECSQMFPIVQCCEFAENCSTPHISIDNYKVGYDAVRHLAAWGHKRIGMISSTNHFNSTRQRQRGYLDALRDMGLLSDYCRIVYVDDSYGFPSSLTAAKDLLSEKERPDAVFCIGDAAAFAAVVTAQEMGIKVPGELSIIGVDDTQYATMMHPYLTSMAQPCTELGRTAIKMLLTLIRGEVLEETEVMLPYGFIERESTGRK